MVVVEYMVVVGGPMMMVGVWYRINVGMRRVSMHYMLWGMVSFPLPFSSFHVLVSLALAFPFALSAVNGFLMLPFPFAFSVLSFSPVFLLHVSSTIHPIGRF